MQNKLKQGEALFAEGKIEETERCFSSLLEKNSEDEELLNNLGVIHHFSFDFRLLTSGSQRSVSDS